MWERGMIAVPQKDGSRVIVRYSVKVYDLGSRFGINGGRISKLWLQIDGECVANYDRGWDIKPTCEAAEIALQILLEAYKEKEGEK